MFQNCLWIFYGLPTSKYVGTLKSYLQLKNILATKIKKHKQTNKQTKNHLKFQQKSNKSTQTLHVHGSSRQINSPFSGQVCGPSTATWKVRNSQWFRGGGTISWGFLGFHYGFTIITFSFNCWNFQPEGILRFFLMCDMMFLNESERLQFSFTLWFMFGILDSIASLTSCQDMFCSACTSQKIISSCLRSGVSVCVEYQKRSIIKWVFPKMMVPPNHPL